MSGLSPRPIAFAAAASAMTGAAIQRDNASASRPAMPIAASTPAIRVEMVRQPAASTAAAGMPIATVHPLNKDRLYGVYTRVPSMVLPWNQPSGARDSAARRLAEAIWPTLRSGSTVRATMRWLPSSTTPTQSAGKR
jgi:hypothetical protein